MDCLQWKTMLYQMIVTVLYLNTVLMWRLGIILDFKEIL